MPRLCLQSTVAVYCSLILWLTKGGARDQQEGRKLSKFSQIMFFFFYVSAISCHLLSVWLEMHKCLQTIATPRDKANCCYVTIVFKAPFCGRLANWYSNKWQMDTHWQCPLCGKSNFCFSLWNMILFFLPLILGFSWTLSPIFLSLSMPGLF